MGDVEPKSVNRGQLPGYADKSRSEHAQEAENIGGDRFVRPETQDA